MVVTKDNLVFIILSGMPCSGKTEWVKRNIDKIGDRHKAPVVVISKDTIREEVYGKIDWKWEKEKEKNVDEKFYKQLGQAANMKHAVVIIDNTHVSEKRIDRYFNIFRTMILNDAVKIYVRFFDVPCLLAKMRNLMRRVKTGKWVPNEWMDEYHKQYRLINKLKYVENIYYDDTI